MISKYVGQVPVRSINEQVKKKSDKIFKPLKPVFFLITFKY